MVWAEWITEDPQNPLTVSASPALASVRSGRGVLFPIDEAEDRLIRPASVNPKPLLRFVADPLLQGRVDPGHQRRSVGVKVAASGYR